MRKDSIENFSKIPQPERRSFGFLEDIRTPSRHDFRSLRGCTAGCAENCLASGFELVNEITAFDLPQTALTSLRRLMKAKNIPEVKGAYPIRFVLSDYFEQEEYCVKTSAQGTVIHAGDCEGVRRAIYFLEDRISEAAGASVSCGEWQRKPFIKKRISRCFFGPTNRPPFFIDELTDDVDYYPEAYLDKLAHEGVNGLWLTMYLKDLPSTVFPGRGDQAAQRFEKLRRTVERCLSYGIKIYVFLSEPKFWGNNVYSVPEKDALAAPETVGHKYAVFHCFCTSSDAGKKYLYESVSLLFQNVPGLGGIINIMLGEDNGACVSDIVSRHDACSAPCPVCSQRDYAEIYAELADLFVQAMCQHNPDADFIGWFYTPEQRDGSDFSERLLRIAEKWPDHASIMFNFESGGTSWQLEKKRIVFDYSLAYVGPSALFASASRKAKNTAAKIQVGCSHENASVPFMPVPENLYDKYKFMYQNGTSSVMQCWYFGNYPGIMNKAAGELSFAPFFENPDAFLLYLAKPYWREYAETVAKAWKYFSQSYRNFPSNIAFEWDGPLHHSIVWPWHLFPVDQGVSPSWILKTFPEVSGDRIGECLGYHHTLDEALKLCTQMAELWGKGTDLMNHIAPHFRNDVDRTADVCLINAINLQMKSTLNLLKFYWMREDMFYHKNNHIPLMRKLVDEEIENTRQMITCCRQDCRLGYHSEAEGYLFHEEKLRQRIALLEELAEKDFPAFELNSPEWDEYTGRNPVGMKAYCHKTSAEKEFYAMGNDVSWCAAQDDVNLYFEIKNARYKNCSFLIEPCRLWTPFRIDLYPDDTQRFYFTVFAERPDVRVEYDGADVKITVPLKIFDGFRRPGFPMRMNIYGDDFAWIKPEPWQGRLLHGDFNPASAGWLILN